MKLNAPMSHVCFGAKDNQFGLFWIPVSGALVAVRLNHVSGTVSCSRGSKSFWGCGTLPSLESIRIIITNSSDYALLPQKPQFFYTIPGYNSNSPQLVFPGFPTPLAVYSVKSCVFGTARIGRTFMKVTIVGFLVLMYMPI